VRRSLEDTLYATYAPLFRQKDLPATQSGMGRSIECSDGWYAILDGLCDAMSVHGRQSGHHLIEIVQVKQKMAGLRIYVDGRCDWCSGAIDFACRLSRHVCEETGRPGILMVRGRMFRTFAEDVGNAKEYTRYQPEDGNSADDGPKPRECLPPGWRTIASVLGVRRSFGRAGGHFAIRAYRRRTLGRLPKRRGRGVRSHRLRPQDSGPIQSGDRHDADSTAARHRWRESHLHAVKSKQRGQSGYVPEPQFPIG
jgi:hypothetical protein